MVSIWRQTGLFANIDRYFGAGLQAIVPWFCGDSASLGS